MPRTTARVRALVTGVVLAATLAACGGDPDEASEDGTGSPGSSTESSGDAAGTDPAPADCTVDNQGGGSSAEEEAVAAALCEIDGVLSAVLAAQLPEGTAATLVQLDEVTADGVLDVIGTWSGDDRVADESRLYVNGPAPEQGHAQTTVIIQHWTPPPADAVVEAFVELDAAADGVTLRVDPDETAARATLAVEADGAWHDRLLTAMSLTREVGDLAATTDERGIGRVAVTYADGTAFTLTDNLDGLLEDPRWAEVVDQMYRAETASTTGEIYPLCQIGLTDGRPDVICGDRRGQEPTEAEQAELDVLAELVADAGGIYTERD